MARLIYILALLTITMGADHHLLSDVCKDSKYCQMCTDTVIKCEGKDDNEHGLLTQIPINDLSPNISRLDFGFNLLESAMVGPSNETLSVYYPNLEYLSLVGNYIHRIGNSFFGLASLEEINLSINPLEIDVPKTEEIDIFKDLTEIRHLNVSRLRESRDSYRDESSSIEPLILALDSLKGSRVEVIDFSETETGPFSLAYTLDIALLVLRLNNTPIKEIYLANNEMGVFYTQLYFNHVYNSRRIYVIDLLNGLSKLEHLEVFDLSHDLRNFPPKVIVRIDVSLFADDGSDDFKKLSPSRLKTLKINTPNIPKDSKVIISKIDIEINMTYFKELEVLELRNVIFDYSKTPFYKTRSFYIDLDGCTFHRGHNLRVLDLSGPHKFTIIDGVIKGLVNLEELNFENNNCAIEPSVLTCLTGTFESLKILKLKGNRVQLNASRPGINSPTRVFNNCSNLELVDLSDNQLNHIPSDILQDAFRLKSLDLSFNKLENINLKFNDHEYFNFLNLSYNMVRKLEETFTIELEKWIQNGTIDLKSNPLSCGCDSIEFVNWLQSYRTRLHHSEDLTCQNEVGETAYIMELQVWALRYQCVKTVVTAVLATAGTIVVPLSIALLIYKWRFRIHYLALLARAHFRQRNNPDAEYYFDGFLSYSNLDKRFAHDTLIRHLETDMGYKLCFDERNFLMGHVLEDMVTVAMSQSRKIILIISQNFLRSGWCTYEMEMANGVLATRGSNCILLILREPLNTIPADLIKPRLRVLLECRLYVEWSEEADKKKLFWRKLQDALGQPGHAELKDEHRRNEYLLFSDQDRGICDDVDNEENRPLLGN